MEQGFKNLANNKMQSQIYIKGFSRSTTKDDLRDFFRDYEGIDDVRLIKDYAFIVRLPSPRISKPPMKLKRLSAIRTALSSMARGSRLKSQASQKVAAAPKRSMYADTVGSSDTGENCLIQETRMP